MVECSSEYLFTNKLQHQWSRTMREVSTFERNQISGGYHPYNYYEKMHPSDWIFSGGAGAASGSLVYAVTAFSANPAGLMAVGIGCAIGMSLHATHDILRYFDL